MKITDVQDSQDFLMKKEDFLFYYNKNHWII